MKIVSTKRYRALNWEAIAENRVVGMGPGEKVDDFMIFSSICKVTQSVSGSQLAPIQKMVEQIPELAELTNLDISLVARNVEWTLAQQQTQVA
ncbi:hypothetical protein DAPPUDRAFT_336001 [Daphnia pulex]|uniref:Uncharacterized protein n=1 Tax=Daphnia pulex TaxID=6669 RepID=E9HYX5_DAPPU|nr:hypothetical protein DAPPUDRAFT_336001 [Daphnia pulex]|eukprot:EFX63053.1 hypothetical protein DAPPUDRAFT_336001 [Daphnia pulex]